ncbi:MAG: putative LPS assembly protein LptD, partial [Bacteroidota bacterium]
MVGPSNLEIAGVPTPLWLPFGFFPTNQKTRNKGLIFPKDYEYSDQWGFGLRNIGWYQPINDYMDLTLTGDIYFNGTWGLQAATRFRKRYKYNGSFSIGYSHRIQEVLSTMTVEENGEQVIKKFLERAPTRSWAIRGSLNQASQAHPTINIGGSVNIQTNNYSSLNRNDAQSVLQQSYSSNFSFRKSFPGKPFSLSAAMSHSQNVQTGRIRIKLPNIDFQTQSFFPFKRKTRPPGQKEQWYEQISMRYKFNAQNEFNTVDTLLFTRQTLRDAQFGAQHDVDLSASFRVLKYFNFSPSADYRETWYFKTQRFNFIDEAVVDTVAFTNPDGSLIRVELDTTAIGRLDTVTTFEFQPIREYSLSASLGTQIFSTLQFKKNDGWFRGLRHVGRCHRALTEGLGLGDALEVENELAILRHVASGRRVGTGRVHH